MINLIFDRLGDPNFMVMVLAAIATGAAILTVAMPLLDKSELQQKMKSVALERDRIRTREREKLAAGQQKATLRSTPKAYMKQVVEQFNLSNWLGTADAKLKLSMAGLRGPSAEVGFLFFRLVTPTVMGVLSIIYVFVILDLAQPLMVKIAICLGAAFLGIKAPEIYLSNVIGKRKASMNRAFPDALDLMLICVESGMSTEMAFRKVAQEIGTQSVPLAEELTLSAAEMSFLQERRKAYENFAARTGLESVKSVTTAMIQADRYGTPLGSALRVLAQESRDQRMNEAEKKAAALPPKLTVPMILFFLPVLIAVILTPAMVQVFKWE